MRIGTRQAYGGHAPQGARQTRGHGPVSRRAVALFWSGIDTFCSALLVRPLKGGVVIAGGITLGGTIEPIHNPIDVVELAMEKGATAVLVPVSSRRALIDLSDDVATKVQVLFYADAPDALRKALHD